MPLSSPPANPTPRRTSSVTDSSSIAVSPARLSRGNTVQDPTSTQPPAASTLPARRGPITLVVTYLLSPRFNSRYANRAQHQITIYLAGHLALFLWVVAFRTRNPAVTADLETDTPFPPTVVFGWVDELLAFQLLTFWALVYYRNPRTVTRWEFVAMFANFTRSGLVLERNWRQRHASVGRGVTVYGFPPHNRRDYATWALVRFLVFGGLYHMVQLGLRPEWEWEIPVLATAVEVQEAWPGLEKYSDEELLALYGVEYDAGWEALRNAVEEVLQKADEDADGGAERQSAEEGDGRAGPQHAAEVPVDAAPPSRVSVIESELPPSTTAGPVAAPNWMQKWRDNMKDLSGWMGRPVIPVAALPTRLHRAVPKRLQRLAGPDVRRLTVQDRTDTVEERRQYWEEYRRRRYW